MSDRGDTREQPSNRDLGALRAEHVFLIVAAVSLSAAVAAYVLDSTLPIELNRGAYSILVAFFVAGYCGWLSRSAERRHRRVAYGELRRLTAAVEELRDQVERQRTVYLPTPGRQSGHMYASASATDSTATAQRRAAVDPEELREEVERVVAEELGSRESVRSQGYAEGYVDGVSRREGDNPTP